MTVCQIKKWLFRTFVGGLVWSLIKYESVQYLLCISRNPAVEEERFVVSEKIFLENLWDYQPFLQVPSLAVQVVGGEAGEFLGVVRHSCHATQHSLQEEILIFTWREEENKKIPPKDKMSPKSPNIWIFLKTTPKKGKILPKKSIFPTNSYKFL